MNKFVNKKGMSLIELIISLAILGIITVLFLSSFTGAYATILGMGHKTKAMAQAQTIIDTFYESKNLSDLSNSADLIESPDTFPTAYNSSKKNVRYYLTSKSVGGNSFDQVSLQVFYQNGKSFITLTSLVP